MHTDGAGTKEIGAMITQFRTVSGASNPINPSENAIKEEHPIYMPRDLLLKVVRGVLLLN